jgi:hypothetical protein
MLSDPKFDNISTRRDKFADKRLKLIISSGLVYVLANESKTACKIGYTQKSCHDRLKDYRQKRKLFGEWYVFAQYRHNQARFLEKNAHDYFSAYRIIGEVFSINPEEVCMWLLQLGGINVQITL